MSAGGPESWLWWAAEEGSWNKKQASHTVTLPEFSLRGAWDHNGPTVTIPVCQRDEGGVALAILWNGGVHTYTNAHTFNPCIKRVQVQTGLHSVFQAGQHS